MSEDASEAAVFEDITDPVENIQNYVPGGLHPVHLGDTLGDARYKVVRKLGYGGYSTVWLAQDLGENDAFVAIKIARADCDHTQEIKIHDELRIKADQHPGSASIMMLKNRFDIMGPNGNHICMVYDALGPSIAHVRDDHVDLKTIAYLTLSSIRKIVYQVLLGLDYMHSVGVVHGDLYAANVLFVLNPLSHEPVEALCQSHDEVSVDVKRVNGLQQMGDPRHLTLNRPLNQFVSHNAEIKLSDLGNSFFEKDPPSKLETPAEIRSPEMILDGSISMAQDCWAFGCLVYNMLTNCYPFDLGFVNSEDSRKDTYLIQLSAFLGPLPIKLRDKWPRYHLYFDDQGQPEKFDVDDDFDPEDAYSYAGSENPSDENHSSMKADIVGEVHGQKAEDYHSTNLSDHAKKPQNLV